MKRIAILIICFSIFLMNFAAVSAASVHKSSAALIDITDQKPVEVTLSEVPETINAGEKVELTACTQKQGSDYTDEWSGAVKGTTELDAVTGAYVSKAEFTADKPGTYTISYSIYMTAGGSDTGFYGKVEKKITVINSVTLVGADIRDLVITPMTRADGSIYLYAASGTVYALWSDQTATPYKSAIFSFYPNETVKTQNVTIIYNGIQYNYTVTVNR